MPDVNRKRVIREALVYLVVTTALSSIFYYLAIRDGTLSARGLLYPFGLMWCPGVSALVTRVAFHRSLRGLGWGWGKTRYQLVSYFLPFAYALPAYGLVWLTGLGGVGEAPAESPWVFVGLGTVVSLIFATGEEIGWRGFLVPQLYRIMGFGRTSIVSGLIWAAWHAPLILFADYNSGAPRWYALLCFTVMVVAISFPFAWLRLKSGSLWTAALLHASHNLYIQGFFDQVTTDTGITEYLTGEFGVVVALVAAVVAWAFWRRRAELPG
jgi:membrane protease YdiL (CAAX protease family)